MTAIADRTKTSHRRHVLDGRHGFIRRKDKIHFSFSGLVFIINRWAFSGQLYPFHVKDRIAAAPHRVPESTVGSWTQGPIGWIGEVPNAKHTATDKHFAALRRTKFQQPATTIALSREHGGDIITGQVMVVGAVMLAEVALAKVDSPSCSLMALNTGWERYGAKSWRSPNGHWSLQCPHYQLQFRSQGAELSDHWH